MIEQQAHIGITGDKKHDSHSMRHFITDTVNNLKSTGIFDREQFTVLCFHSDNASQHFKSSKSLHWLSCQLQMEHLMTDDEVQALGFRSALWDFGCPWQRCVGWTRRDAQAMAKETCD